MKLENLHVLITGGGSGIGLALAEQLLARSNKVAICGRNAEKLAAANDRCGGKLITLTCDLGDEQQLQGMIATLKEQWDHLDLLVNNAGIQYALDFTASPGEEFFESINREITTNLSAVIKLSALSVPFLAQDRAQGRESRIVNIGSSLALVPKKSAPVYCATKAAVHSFTQAFRYQMEDAGKGIAVSLVILPIVDTPMTAGRGSGKISADWAAREICAGIERNRDDIYVGKARLLKWLMHFFPALPRHKLRNA